MTVIVVSKEQRDGIKRMSYRREISSIGWQVALFGIPAGVVMCLVGFSPLVLVIVPALLVVCLVRGYVLLTYLTEHFSRRNVTRCALGATIGCVFGALAAVALCATMEMLPIVLAL